MWACCEWEFTAPPTDGGSILWHAAVFLQELGKKSHLITGGGLIQAIWTATDAFQLRRSIPQSTTALFWIAEVSCRSHFQIRSCLFACAPKGTNRMSLDHCWTFMVATECWKSCPSSCTKVTLRCYWWVRRFLFVLLQPCGLERLWMPQGWITDPESPNSTHKVKNWLSFWIINTG